MIKRIRWLLTSWWALPISMALCAILAVPAALVVAHLRSYPVNPVDRAVEFCKGYVRAQIVSTVRTDFYDVLYAGAPPKVTITGMVRFPNSFGTPILFSWTCSVGLDGDALSLRYFQANPATRIA